MKPPKMIDNRKNGTVAEELRLELTKDSKLSVMTAYFTIFAFAELKLCSKPLQRDLDLLY